MNSSLITSIPFYCQRSTLMGVQPKFLWQNNHWAIPVQPRVLPRGLPTFLATLQLRAILRRDYFSYSRFLALWFNRVGLVQCLGELGSKVTGFHFSTISQHQDRLFRPDSGLLEVFPDLATYHGTSPRWRHWRFDFVPLFPESLASQPPQLFFSILRPIMKTNFKVLLLLILLIFSIIQGLCLRIYRTVTV